MEVVGQEDFNQVYVGKGEQIVIIGEDAIGRNAPPRPARLGELGVNIAHGDDARPFVGQVFQGVQVGDAPGADETDP